MEILKIETNLDKKIYFKESKEEWKNYSSKIENSVINIFTDIEKQKIIGFGGAVTQSSGIAYKKLQEENKTKFIQELFGDYGYNIVRIPMGSCDFSDRTYSYSKKKDLSDFSIEEDYKHIIPLLQDIKSFKPDVKILASPWSPPSFMKSNKIAILGGKLKEKYYEIYSNYFVKYIKEYEKIGLNIDYITIQNEPYATQTWESCIFSIEEEYYFMENYLYPNFERNDINTKILIYDHNKEKMYQWANEIFSKSNHADGLAFHSYSGEHFEAVNACRNKFPDKLLFHTERCVGFSNFNPNNEQVDAEIYGIEILNDLNNGTNCFLDWNILLDKNGGPNHKRNYCNSPIMLVNNETDYYKNLCYYYIGHFSKIIKDGAVNLGYSRYSKEISVTAFRNLDGSIVVVLINTHDWTHDYNLCINDICITGNMDKRSIISYVIK